jgi:hypothetical protein
MKAATLVVFALIALLAVVPLAFLPWLSFDFRLGVGGRILGCFGGCSGGRVYVGTALMG